MTNEISMKDNRSFPNSGLVEALRFLSTRPPHNLPSPETQPKRASVALIIWIKPPTSYSINTESPAQTLDELFEQQWAREGDPHVLFIKRAARTGDRWSAHVALPGGKRDPEDVDDRFTAERETREEIGLDLTSENSLYCGGLDQRTVSTSATIIPLMVLCPYVYVLTSPIIPTLNLQPSEIDSVHFVSLDLLLSPTARTFEYVNTSRRLVPHAHPLIQKSMRLMLGQMKFAAIKLEPTSSVPPHAKTHQLQLWGLTLDVLTDILDMMPPHSSRMLWTFPTYSSPDVAFFTFILTVSSRRKARKAWKIAADTHKGRTMDWVGLGLGGYFTSVRRAIVLALIFRTVLAGWMIRWIFKRLRTVKIRHT